jgi:colanic acid biosynthesis protein WcaH
MIPKKDYTKILASVPVPTVDILVIRDKKCLLVRRQNRPLKGHWWLPGGRVMRGETLLDAVSRKLSEELGIIEFQNGEYVGVYEDQYRDNDFGLDFIHTISSVFVVQVAPGTRIKLDGQSSAHKWVSLSKMPGRLQVYTTDNLPVTICS